MEAKIFFFIGSLIVVGSGNKIGGQESCNETPSHVNDKSEGDNGVKRDRTSVRLQVQNNESVFFDKWSVANIIGQFSISATSAALLLNSGAL